MVSIDTGKMVIKVVVLCFIIALSVAEKVSYEGYRLYKVVPETDDQIDTLLIIRKDGLGQFWDEYFVVNKDIRIMVRSDNVGEFLKRVEESQMTAKLALEDIQKTIDDQMKTAKASGRSSTFLSLNWDQYHNLDKIYSWLDEVADAYPDVARTVIMGRSFENREIKGVVINYRPELTSPFIGMIESTIHAREWITPAVVTWIIKEFLTSSDPDIRFLAENLEWHIFPVVNPDGYVYTFTDNRMWRKNRSTASFTTCNSTQVSDDMSNGVDLNRNFDYVWNTVGVSPDPCSNTYPGPMATSEPETLAIVQYVHRLNGIFTYYLAFHSFTQLVVIPYSDLSISEALMKLNYVDMYEVAVRGADKMRERFGKNYTVGLSSDIMYPMSGTSFDWVKNATDVPISFLLELRDLGHYGFLLPPDQIIPTSLETMDFLISMDKNTRDMGFAGFPRAAASSLQSIAILVISASFGLLIKLNLI